MFADLFDEKRPAVEAEGHSSMKRGQQNHQKLQQQNQTARLEAQRAAQAKPQQANAAFHAGQKVTQGSLMNHFAEGAPARGPVASAQMTRPMSQPTHNAPLPAHRQGMSLFNVIGTLEEKKKNEAEQAEALQQEIAHNEQAVRLEKLKAEVALAQTKRAELQHEMDLRAQHSNVNRNAATHAPSQTTYAEPQAFNTTSASQIDFLADELAAVKNSFTNHNKAQPQVFETLTPPSAHHSHQNYNAPHGQPYTAPSYAEEAAGYRAGGYEQANTHNSTHSHHVGVLRGAAFPFSFEKVIAAFLRLWWWILLCAIGGAVLAGAYALTLPNKYVSVAEVLIEPRGINVVNDSVTPSGLNSEATVAYAESQVRIIFSSSVLDPVIERFNLDRDPEFIGQNGLLGGLLSGQGGDAKGSAKKYLIKNLTVRRINQTFTIHIAVETTDPAKSAKLANAIAESYIADEAGARSTSARDASKNLSENLDDLATKVRQSEEAVEKHKVENGLVNADGKLVSEARLSSLNEQLTLAQVQEGDARTRSEQAAKVDLAGVISHALPSSLVTRSLDRMRQDYNGARRKLAASAVTLGKRHPERIAADAELRSSRDAIAEEIKRIVSSTKEEYKRAKARVADLQAKVNQQRARSENDSSALVQLRALEREVEANRKVYAAYLLRSRETEEQGNISARSARVISPAVADNEKTSPNRKLIVAGGGILGGGFGAFIGLIPFAIGGLRQMSGGGAPSAESFKKPRFNRNKTYRHAADPNKGPIHGQAAAYSAQQNPSIQNPQVQHSPVQHSSVQHPPIPHASVQGDLYSSHEPHQAYQNAAPYGGAPIAQPYPQQVQVAQQVQAPQHGYPPQQMQQPQSYPQASLQGQPYHEGPVHHAPQPVQMALPGIIPAHEGTQSYEGAQNYGNVQAPVQQAPYPAAPYAQPAPWPAR